MDEINWGIVGCGDVTELKSGPAFNKIAGSKLISVMRRNGAKAEDYARRHHVPNWTDNADELINDPGVNAIYIATPPASHAEFVLKAAQAKKPVYVEKPMALTSVECETMIAACKENNIPLFVAYYRRCLPNFLTVKEIIESGEIGEIRFVTINLFYSNDLCRQDENDDLPWRVKSEISGGGYFVDLASHQLDWLDFVFGPIKFAEGLARNQGGFYLAEDIVTANFEFESEVVGNGIWCFTTEKSLWRDRIEIFGSKGKVTLATFERVPFLLEKSGETMEINVPYPENIQRPLIQTVVDELAGSGKCPSTGESGARTTRIMETILSGYYQ